MFTLLLLYVLKVKDMELIPYRYSFYLSSCSCACWGKLLKKAKAVYRFKSDRDEIWHNWTSAIEVVFFWYDVTLSRWRPWRHITQKSLAAVCCSACPPFAAASAVYKV